MRGVSDPSATVTSKTGVALDRSQSGDVTVVRVTGLVDEKFAGFGNLGTAKAIVIDVSGMTRMTSFGVRQWMKAMTAIPPAIADRYLLGCPMFFIDQLNMVLNFAGGAQILTAVAPYMCASCGSESGEMIDLLTERATLKSGAAPRRTCGRCGQTLELDESPESYFAFAAKYGATKLRRDVARALAQLGLYTSQAPLDKPPKVIKLVQGSVTYFRIIGSIDSMFRARPFVMGAEGEIVIDLAELERFEQSGRHEWRRLIKNLAAQVTAVTLVDIGQSFLATAADSFAMSNVFVASILVPYTCAECGRHSQQSHSLASALPVGDQVCATCGGKNVNELTSEMVDALRPASVTVPPGSAKLIAKRADVLSRALTDAKVAEAGNTGPVEAADTIIGNYKIVRKLSGGGMADVFLANQIGIGGFEKPVAVKRIQRKFLESRHLAVDMFLNEAKIAGRLLHPNIVQVLDVGEVGGGLYLAMEYVRGKDLRDVHKMLQANGELMPLGIACHIIRDVALALHHAYWSTDHEGNRLAVVHRDVSPHNIIISFDGVVKLLDFGVAMSSVTEEEQQMVVGKWMYMSPEHTTKQIDHRSDLFSLGVILYLLCAGRLPFAGKDPIEILHNIEHGEYPRLTGVPPALGALVDKMLAGNPANRPQTGEEVASELAAIMRANRLESTNSSEIASFLNQLFIYETAPVEMTATTEIDDNIVMDVTTIKLAIGSGPTQAQGTPSAGMRIERPTAITPTELAAVAPDSISFATVPSTTKAPRRSLVLWAAIGALLIAAALIAAYLRA
ncbi:MAG TPA: serine/threonine-protein kinase [Kofleriaceae bacterium]|nr:serine/threonine-protein kinase [Kofleriaceae bacterium]